MPSMGSCLALDQIHERSLIFEICLLTTMEQLMIRPSLGLSFKT